MWSPNTYKRYPVEFSVSHTKEWDKVVEEIIVLFNDPNYEESVKRFSNFINSVKDNTIRFCHTEKNIPDQVYNRLIKFSSDDYQELFQAYTKNDADRYFLILKSKWFKAIQYYITKIFFANFIIHDIDQWIAQLKQRYPLVSNSHFAKLQSNKFKNECIQSVVDDIDDELWTAAQEVLSLLQSQNPEVSVYTNMLYTLLQTIAIWCSDWFLTTKFRENRQQLANATLRATQERKERIEKEKIPFRPIRVISGTQETIHNPEPTPTKRLSHEHEKLLEQLESTIQKRVKIDISYIKRMLRKWWPIYIESLVQDMGEWYSESLLEEIVNIIGKFDVQIVTKKDSEIQEIINPTQHQNLPKVSKTQEWPISPTLQQIQDTPEKLTTEVLITICKELWYRFWDEKEFMDYANDLGLAKSWKTAIFIKKKLIDYLTKPENDVWIPEWSRETKSYEKLTFNDWSRMVKQRRTILWLTDHETYEKLIQRHFTTNKTDFDKLLQYQSWWPEDIDPRCI